jgi:putative tricarboxylic transport membrane protein
MIVGVLILHVRRVLAERREIKAEKFANKHASTNFGFYLKNRQTRIMNTRSKSVRRSHLRYSRRDK